MKITAKMEWLDALTREVVPPGDPGGEATGRFLARAPVGKRRIPVAVEEEWLLPATTRIQVDPRFFPQLRERGREALAAREEDRARARDERKLLKRASADTFYSPAAGARTWAEMNEGWIDAVTETPNFELTDVARDWADRIEVKVGKKKQRRWAKTKRGREALEAIAEHKQSGVVELIRALLTTTPKRRGRYHWRDVDWELARDLFDEVQEGTGIVPVWWPGSLDPYDEVQAVAPEDLDVWWRLRLATDLREVLTRYQRALRDHGRCLTAQEKKIAERRLRALKRWAKDPASMPPELCSEWEPSGYACDRYDPLERAVKRLESACELATTLDVLDAVHRPRAE